MSQPPTGTWSEEEIELSEIADLNKRKVELKTGYSTYLLDHPEIKTALNGFMTAALLEKPANVFEFARAHFAGIKAEYQAQDYDGGKLAPLVLTGPPGAGKHTLIARLHAFCPGQFAEPLRHTTRPAVAAAAAATESGGEGGGGGEGEMDGVDAHFVNPERLTADLENGKMFHHERDMEQGTQSALSFQAVDDVIASGKIPVFALPVASYKKLLASGHFPEVRSVFVRPHEVAALAGRLEERGRDSAEMVTRKLTQAAEDMEWGKSQQDLGLFGRSVVNAALESAVAELKESITEWYPHVESNLVYYDDEAAHGR